MSTAHIHTAFRATWNGKKANKRVSWNLSKTQPLNSHLCLDVPKLLDRFSLNNCGVPKIKSKHLWKNTAQIIKHSLQSFIMALLKKNKTRSASVLSGERGRNILSGHCSIKHTGQAKSCSSRLPSFYFGTNRWTCGEGSLFPAKHSSAEDGNFPTKDPPPPPKNQFFRYVLHSDETSSSIYPSQNSNPKCKKVSVWKKTPRFLF